MKLEDVFIKIVEFLEKYKLPYLIIGGIAAGVLGEPRATGDIDIDIKIKKGSVNDFLKNAERIGFRYDKKEEIKKVKNTGTFKIWHGDFHIDFLISSTEFEEIAFKRHKRIKIFGIKANFPTPEDLILFKIIPARPVDKIDAENIVKRHWGKLDKQYLMDWAIKLADEAEDLRIYREVKKLLR